MLATLVLLSLAAAPAGLLARRDPRKTVGWWIALIPFVLFVVFCSRIPAIIDHNPISDVLPWAPALGIELNFYLDGLSLLFALIITGIGTLIVIYTGYYLADDKGIGRFLLYLLIFMSAMLGLVLAGNVLTLYVFWELTSISSYLLIGFKYEKEEARDGAKQALLITTLGGLSLLVGLLMLGAAAQLVGVPAAQAYDIQAILSVGDQIKETPLYNPAIAFIILGCFTKSAQFPFHFWLPGAMQAPTPASAYLHSATMVKAGIYLLARFHPGLGDTPIWTTTLTLFGAFTLLMGAVIAVRQTDIKGLLAYSTVSMLGAIVMLLGIGGEYGPRAAIVNIVAHALYKSSLFMIAGIVDHEAGSRDMRELGGLRSPMPVSLTFSILALLSLSGIPIMFGFVAKELMLEGALDSPLPLIVRIVLLATIVVSAAFYIAYSWRLLKNVFLNEPAGEVREKLEEHHVHEPSYGMLVGPGVPAALSLLLCFGLLGPLSALLSPAVDAVAGEEIGLKLALWHGVNIPLILSITAILTGIGLAYIEYRIADARSLLPAWLTGEKIYHQIYDGLLDGAEAITRRMQDGRLRIYTTVTLLTMVGLVLPPFLRFGLNDVNLSVSSGVRIYEIIAALLVPVGIIVAIRSSSRISAIIAVSVVGAMVSLFFVIFSAPDLALTQLLIEVLTAVFLLFVFSVLPARFDVFAGRKTQIFDTVVAVSVGLLMGGLTLVASTYTLYPRLAPYFLNNSVPEGQGGNVVNVILVDFRGFDTLGEITVLFIAVIGIYGLLRMRQRSTLRTDPERQELNGSGNGRSHLSGPTSPVTATASPQVVEQTEH